VLDEKMKDAVKITVIATGFRDSERPHRKTESTGFTVNAGADDFDSEPESSPMVMESHQPSQMAGASAEVASVDNMRNAMIANFEQADLDVPAFLRKRGDAM
jgi:cell division GTPase FtsZ